MTADREEDPAEAAHTPPAAADDTADADPAPEPGPGSDATPADDDSVAPESDTSETSDTEPSESGTSATGDGTKAAEGPAELSDAQAELLAQRELRARIEQRRAEKSGPIAAGTKLSGTAADLLAAVRAVEGGGTPDPALMRAVAPARPAPPAEPGPAAPGPAGPAGRPPRAAAPAEAVAGVRGVLAAGGAPEALAGPVTETLGERAADALRDDPWQLLAVPGVRPEQADGFARALLGADCRPDDGRRAVALVVWLLERAALQGHTSLPATTVRESLAAHKVPDADAAVAHAASEGAVLVFREGGHDEDVEERADDEEGGAPEEETPEVPVLLGLDRYALAEESLADGIARLVKTVKDAPDDTAWVAAASGPAAGAASELLRAVAGHGLVLHTGGEAARAEPVVLVRAARTLGLRAAVAVHSDNGRARLDPDTVTVAGLLAGTEGPGRDTDGMLALDLLVVLDAPQLDVESATELVESLADGCRLVLGGDPEVLWSAGAGRVFADLLAARVCPRVASRTPDPGPLGELVSGIGVGELQQVPAPDKEIVIVPVRDAGEAVHRTVQLVAESVPRAFGVTAEETQVITVGHGGAAGTRALNAALKQRLAPGPGRFGGFDPGDRVAYVPSPGRTLQGSVVSAEADGLRIDCAGTSVTVPRDRVTADLRHGWALTAHQAAGMRWPAVVAVLPGDAVDVLSRPWVYTAFGRAERHLSVVHGVEQALPRAVAEVPAKDRSTRLRALVEELLAPPAVTE